MLPPKSLRSVRTSAFRSCRSLGPRHVSSSANPFPFPTNTHPTPHQIFHLPPSATKDEVKTRYYDLVRIYHPDSAISRAVPPDTAHARFQAISAAYSVLTGKARRMGDVESDSGNELRPDYNSLSTAMWKAKQRRRAELNVGTDDRWKDALMFGAITLSVAAFVWQAHSARQQAIAAAQNAPDWSQSWRTRKTTAKRPAKATQDDSDLLAER
ncbi:uncharacterized protein C8Q71DRAFT_749446 [Rhodofomes roseus]|uniref:J domain-containing protein n=1 Tax=Rhodofomes roseus TaxID=34475 RepID=A0ABQ8KMT2_9APHY|nr:uncharacterized protein C8Q71DRAFT_749446 [Rhodofomes roseus]KAH9839424.1 hypothetical protein C8Q71DRAFT_749446 [Rhodofomes roseus]